MNTLPSGTITFLFTDIQGSTELLKQLGESYATLLADQRQILRTAFEKWDGREIDTQGDAFFASFPRATQAVAAVVEIQRALAAHDWPEDVEVRVRMGLHTGEPWLVEEGYVGMDVHRAARIAHIGYGGQVLLSETTAPLVQDELPEGVALLDLGRHRLKDLRRPEHLHQLVIDGLPSEFPPLNSLEVISQPGLPEAQASARPPREVGPSPYRGLAAFQEKDAQFFFGRESFTAQLAEAVQHHSLVAVVVGSSGSGKSSTIFAGLLPSLRNAGNWLILQMRPGREPFHALASAFIPILEEDLSRSDHLLEIQKLAQALRTGDLSLIQVVELALETRTGSKRLLLVIDQFEELYTLCPDAEVRRAFHDELLATVVSGSQGHKSIFSLLLTLRADFMGQALGHRPFADALQESSFMLGPMNRDELRTAIEKPAELQGAAFEPGLVDRLLDDVGQEPGNLPLLEFALTLLWDQIDGGWMTHEAYEEIGRVEGSLARYADEVYEKLNPVEWEETRRVFMQLVQPGEGTEDTRRVARRDELVGVDWDLIQHLANERLVVTGLDERGNETVEVVHEALIRNWGQMREWMATDREFRRWQEGLRAALRAWEDSDRDEGALLRGTPLAQAVDWLAVRGDEIRGIEKEYIRTSIEFEHHRLQVRERRRRMILSGLAVGFVIAMILSAFAFSQRSVAEQSAAAAEAEAHARATQQVLAESEARARATQQDIAETEAQARATQQSLAEDAQQRAETQAHTALSRNLALDAIRNLGNDAQLSLLLALQAVDQTYSVGGSVLPDALTALHQAVQANARLLLTIPAKGGRKPYVSFHPDGVHLTVYYLQEGVDPKSFPQDTLTSVYNAYTGELVGELPEGIIADHWPDSGHVAMVDLLDEHTLDLTIWDPLDGTKMFQNTFDIPVATPLDEIAAMTLNQDMTIFALSTKYSGHTFLWDVQSGELQRDIFNELFTIKATWGRSLIGGLNFFNTTLTSYVTFSPDGSHLFTKHYEVLGQLFHSWDLSNPDLEPDTRGLPGDAAFIISPDSHSLAETWGNDVTLFDLDYEEEPLALFGGTEADISVPTFSPDGLLLATTGEDGFVWIWDLQTSHVTGGGELHLSLPVPDSAIHHMSLQPDGSRLATASEDGSVRIWEIQQPGGIEWLTLASGGESGSDSRVSIAISPDGGHLAVADSSPSPKVFNTETWELSFSLQGHANPVRDLAYSPDGTLIATCSDAGPLKIWSADTGQQLAELDDYNDGPCSLAFHPQGNAIALGLVKNQSGWFQVLDLPTHDLGVAELMTLNRPFDLYGAHIGDPIDIAISPDGNRIALTYGGQRKVLSSNRETGFRVYDMTRGGTQDINFIVQNRNYISVAYSTDGSYLAATLPDGIVEIWDTHNHQLAKTLSGHEGPVNRAAFSPGDLWLATAGADGTTRIWDLDTGLEIMTLFGHVGAVTDVTFSPDNRFLYSTGSDGSIRVYLIDIEELIELAESRVTRSLSDEECQTYLHLEVCPETP